MTAPGWYPDPSGKPMQRYFDGTDWTEHYAAAGTKPQPPSATAQPPNPVVGWWQDLPRLLKVVVVAAVGIAVIGIGNAISGDSGEDDRAGSSSSPDAPPSEPTFSPELIESTVIDTCHEAIRKGLRDPESATFDEWKAWPAPNSVPPEGMPFNPAAGDQYYSGAGLVNAKNGFGGYVGKTPYTCSAVVTKAGDVKARTSSLEEALNEPPR